MEHSKEENNSGQPDVAGPETSGNASRRVSVIITTAAAPGKMYPYPVFK
jgi:hypothetical protein